MKKQLIAIIDDEPDIGNLLERIVRLSGFEAFATTNADEFLQVCRMREPSAAIIDLMMPGMDGIQIMEQLSTMHDAPPIILASGSDGRVRKSAANFAAAKQLNVLASLSKPFRIETVERLLADVASRLARPTSREIEGAIAAEQLILHYQPVFKLSDEPPAEVAYVEALVRWRHPTRGLLYPNAFLDAVQGVAAWRALTISVIKMALAQMASWDRDGFSARVAINLPSELLTDRALPDTIEALALQYGIENDRLLMEITESAAMEDPTLATEIMTRLRLKRFGLRIDDFGTGFSSLMRLYRMPFDQLKIDQSFVMNADTDEEARAIIKLIIALARSLDLKVCAEGVETAATLSFLRDAGCDEAQGYHLCHPAAAQEIETHFSAWHWPDCTPQQAAM